MGGHHHHHDDLNHDRNALHIALVLNVAMCGVEIWQGMISNSTSLLADSVDFASDALSYVITLYVLTKSIKVRAKAAMFKAFLMLMLAAIVLTEGVHNVISGEIPAFTTMTWVGTLALIANVISAGVLFRSRSRDSNMKSVWLCSRNDAIANIAIIIAAFFVYLTNTLWPDLLVAVLIAGLSINAALQIFAQAKKELNHGK